MRLYLIRHAQSENNILTDATMDQRQVDPGLTELGLRQRDLLADFLANGAEIGSEGFRIDRLYTSAMYRSLLTSQPISQALGLKPEVWLPLHELGGMYKRSNGSDLGFGGMSSADINLAFPAYQLPEAVTEAGWYDAKLGFEPIAHSLGRAETVARTLRQWSGSEDTIALVSHAGFLNLLLWAIFDDAPGHERWRYYHNNTAITRIDYERGAPVLHYLNRVDHLGADLRSF